MDNKYIEVGGLYRKNVDVGILVGKTISNIVGLEQYSEQVLIETRDGGRYLFYHYQDCCEEVTLNDFEGDPSDLIGGYISLAEEVTESGDEDYEGELKPSGYYESFTWTFYKIDTTKGSLWMRWLGESNGYYSEDVSLVWLNKPDNIE